MAGIKRLLKKTYLKCLYLFPHNSIYEFHHVSDKPEIDLSPRKIETEAFMDFIEKHGPYIAVSEILEKKLSGFKAVTFDDGLADVYETAYPFLKRNGIPFTIFVLAEKLDHPGYITTDQLLEMEKDPLVTVGSHGLTHIRIGEQEAETQFIELNKSKKILEQTIGGEYSCRYFAYPFGSYNKTTLSFMAKAGYAKGFAVKGRPLLPWNRKTDYEIPRLSIDSQTLQFYKDA